MKLDVAEKVLLGTYLEIFNRYYDIYDERRYQVVSSNFAKEMLVRHIEVQNIFYLLDCCLVPVGGDYGFHWSYKGPYSEKLQLTLERLDKKGPLIEEFYRNYNDKNNILFGFLTKDQAQKIANIRYIFEDVLKQDEGSEIIGGILYIFKTLLPGRELPSIMNELKNRGYNPNPDLAEAIWKDLCLLGLREMDTRGVTRERKLVSKYNGGIS